VPGCLLLTLATLPCPAPACSLCANLNLKQKQTFRQEAVHPSARLVLYGTLANPRLGGATPGGGVTDFRVETVLKGDPTLEAQQKKGRGDVITLPRYVPVSDPKDPPRFLVFCDVDKDKDKDVYDPYHGVPVKSGATADYVKGALALDAKDTSKSLLYFF